MNTNALNMTSVFTPIVSPKQSALLQANIRVHTHTHPPAHMHTHTHSHSHTSMHAPLNKRLHHILL
jgi:hypothetical protein